MDLLEMLADVEAVEGDDGLNHVVYPNLGLVCGRDTLAVLRAARGRPHAERRLAVAGPGTATCPGCVAGYSVEVSVGMQSRQAVMRS